MPFTNITHLTDFLFKNLDWQKYETQIGGIWAGGRMQYEMTQQASTPQFARALLKEIALQYNPPFVDDPDCKYSHFTRSVVILIDCSWLYIQRTLDRAE